MRKLRARYEEMCARYKMLRGMNTDVAMQDRLELAKHIFKVRVHILAMGWWSGHLLNGRSTKWQVVRPR
jgi:hypothetical protein